MDVRAFCIVEDEQPSTLAYITTIPQNGTIMELYTLNKTDADPPDPSIFMPPSHCRSVNVETALHSLWPFLDIDLS